LTPSDKDAEKLADFIPGERLRRCVRIEHVKQAGG
jgi:hypothetical protein